MSHSVIELPIKSRRMAAGVGLVTATVLLLAASVSAQTAAPAGLGTGSWLDDAVAAGGEAAGTRPALPQGILAAKAGPAALPAHVAAPQGGALSGLTLLHLASGQGQAPEEQVAVGLPPPIDKRSDVILQVSSAGRLINLFERMEFSLDSVRDSAEVPRIFIAEFPDDLRTLDDSDLRKELFFSTLLPLVLRVNESILHERARLIDLRNRVIHGHALSPRDRAWLAGLAERYEAPEDDLGGLLQRVDIVPPSMALAQAAVESGWGTSVLARRGNAVFGQTTQSEGGLRGRDGDRFTAFDRLIDAAEAYASNLNTHPAYRSFRTLRAEARAAGRAPDGYALLAGLDSYSRLGREYVSYVRRVIRANDLQALDRARLVPDAARRMGSPI